MKRKNRLCCDYIDDPQLFKAVCYSLDMIREGFDPPLAHSRAAKYYGVRIYEVARYVGQHASRIKETKRGRRE
jgi:hypothetical protein